MSGSKKKTRVYLSKSKAGKTEDLNKVLSLLKQYDNVEVVMWDNNDGYDKDKHHKLIASCDILLMLPHKIPEPYNFYLRMGKGQYSEFDFATEDAWIPVNFVMIMSDELYVATEIVDEGIVDENWQTDYSYIEVDNNIRNIGEVHDWYKKNKTNVAISKSQHNLMLACYKRIIKA